MRSLTSISATTIVAIAMLLLGVAGSTTGQAHRAKLMSTVPNTLSIETMDAEMASMHEANLKSGSPRTVAHTRIHKAYQETRAEIDRIHIGQESLSFGSWFGSRSPGGIVDLKNEGTYYLFQGGNFSVSSEQPFIVKGEDSVSQNVAFNMTVLATATYRPTLHTTGWDYLDIEANKEFASSDNFAVDQSNAWFYAGIIEGSVTADRIWANYLISVQRFANTPENKPAREFIMKQILYILLHCYAGYNDGVPKGSLIPQFNSTLALVGIQLMGLQQGYSNYAESVGGQPVTLSEMFYLNYQPEIGDVDIYLTETAAESLRTGKPMDAHAPKTLTTAFTGVKHLPKPRSANQHCSALIKPTVDDLFMSHDTWSNFNSMLRQYKTYHFATPAAQGGKPLTLSMSSYPGMLSSMDDWYLTSHGLTVQETTNGLYNNSLYKVFSHSTVPEWMRVMTANYAATNGKEWTDYFVHLNSGSYNNQWMVVDMKLYKPQSNKPAKKGQVVNTMNTTFLPDGLLWVSETLPGYAMSGDVTYKLREQGYWASYNIPFFPEIYALSGNGLMMEEYGSFFSNVTYARPEIFKRNQGDVMNLTDMQTIMRYNEFKTDPLSVIPNCTSATNQTCTPKYSSMLTIASRGDLDPAVTLETAVPTMGILASLDHPNFGYVGQQNLGAIDSKIASWKNMRNGKMEGRVISGPTSQTQPVFDYKTAPTMIKDQVRYFVPERWDFDWISYTPTKRTSGFFGCYVVDSVKNTFDPNSIFMIKEGPIPEWTKVDISFQPPTSRMVAATASYNATKEITGWDQLTITANGYLGTSAGRVAAGYLEGYLTADRMWDYYQTNVLPSTKAFPGTGQQSWIEAHMAYMSNLQNVSDLTTKAARNAAPAGFIKQLTNIWDQMRGMLQGYNRAMIHSSEKKLTLYDIFNINFGPEFDDVAVGVNQTNWEGHGRKNFVPPPPMVPTKTASSRAHCSAFIKPTKDDLFMAHTTWSNFNSMIRQYKTYDFNGAAKLSFSSYPGMLVSSDDWYISGNNMSIQETTNLIYNNTLYKAFTPETVSAWLRAMIANYQANSGEEWTTLFGTLNSGSYNNQWMVVDYKVYAKAVAQPSGTKWPGGILWITETLPGVVARQDVTSYLNDGSGYWASYNIPFFPEIYRMSGNLAMFQEYGSYFSYSQYVRPRMFRRQEGAVTDLAGMQAIMRYNEFETDSYSVIPNCTSATDQTCTPKYSSMLAISSRGDLDPIGQVDEMGILASNGDPALGFVGQQNLGALDAKIASYKQMETFTGTVISGPTALTQPVFDYATVPYMIANPSGGITGIPERFDFDWVQYNSTMPIPVMRGIAVPSSASSHYQYNSSGSGSQSNGGFDRQSSPHHYLELVLSCIAVVTIVVGCIFFCCRRRSSQKQQLQGVYAPSQYSEYQEVGKPLTVSEGGYPVQTGTVHGGNYGAVQQV